jgi:hypothetical protein
LRVSFRKLKKGDYQADEAGNGKRIKKSGHLLSQPYLKKGGLKFSGKVDTRI